MSKKHIILALTGHEYSSSFLMQWSETILELTKQGYSIGVSTGVNKRTHIARLQSLGLEPLRGKDQKPFDGKVPYDVWLSIDHDVIFTPKQVIELVEDTDKFPVISGMYRVDGAVNLSYISKFDDEYYKKNGGYEMARVESVDPNRKHIPVDHTEMGFFACTREVIEKMTYPYFYHPPIEIQTEDDKTLVHMVTDDEAFCRNVKTAGYVVHVNTDVRVGREKKIVL